MLYKIVRKLIYLLFLTFILDLIVGFSLERLYFSQKAGLNYRTTYTLKFVKDNVLIVGNSRANHHYVPKIFEKELFLDCYNGGRDGQGIFYIEAVLNSVLSRYQPHTIIIDVQPEMFVPGRDKYDRLAALLPYSKSSASVRDVIRLKGPFESIKLFSKIYPYNSMLLTMLYYNLFGIVDSCDGYIPLDSQMEEREMSDVSSVSFGEGVLTDPLAIMSLERICRRVRETSARVIFCISPYFDISYNPLILNYIIDILDKYNIFYFNMSFYPNISGRRLYFSDPYHLNNRGAQQFTEILCQLIKQNGLLYDSFSRKCRE